MTELGFLLGISVLPAMFFNILATSMFFSAVPDFLMEKICSPLERAEIDTICDNTLLVMNATDLASTRNVWRSLLSTVCVPLFAHWRDYTGNNKPLVIVGIVAETVAALIYLISSLEWSISPWLTAIAEAVVGGLFGETICFLGVNCIIIDNSTPENRTMRIQVLLSLMFVVNCLASIIYGFVLTWIGYTWFYSAVVCLQVVSITLVILMVADKKRPRVGKKGLCQNMKIVFEAHRNRAVLWMMMISTALVETYSSAENSIMVFYLQQGFNFSIVEEGIIDAYYALVLAIGSLIFPYIFTKILKWSDFKIGIVSALATIVYQSVKVFIKTKELLYAVVYLGLLKCVLFSIPQSIISKCVKEHELGQFFGMISIIRSIITSSFNKFYAFIFSSTSKIWPGAFFGIGCLVNIIVLVFLSVSCLLARPNIDEDTNPKECENSPENNRRINLWVIHKQRT